MNTRIEIFGAEGGGKLYLPLISKLALYRPSSLVGFRSSYGPVIEVMAVDSFERHLAGNHWTEVEIVHACTDARILTSPDDDPAALLMPDELLRHAHIPWQARFIDLDTHAVLMAMTTPVTILDKIRLLGGAEKLVGLDTIAGGPPKNRRIKPRLW